MPSFKGVWYAVTNFALRLLSDPARVNTHGITDEQMIVLDAMHLEGVFLIYSALHEHYRRKEGKNYGFTALGS